MKSCLLLGVFYTTSFATNGPKRGQTFRDGIRVQALQDAGYSVRTLDNKHVNKSENTHCNANFVDFRRMYKEMKNTFGENVSFDHIILDYFFSPTGWARDRWSAKFWSETIVLFAINNVLVLGGKIWIPNIPCVQESLNNYSSVIRDYYRIIEIHNALENPLCAATETVTYELLQCPDALTNETQLEPLHNISPFLCLVRYC